ncbi:4'-phosphopantetheinyl transferase family protein, partial [Kitasatospora cinereorecta]
MRPRRLRRLLGAHLGIAPRTVSVARAPCPCCGEPHGRPVLPDGRLHFSLSHCEGMSLIAVAAHPVGVDVEPVPAPETVGRPRRCSTRSSRPSSPRSPPDAAAVAFARSGPGRRPILKGIGVGLGADPATEYVGSGPLPSAP